MWCKNKIKFLGKKNILECLWLLLDSICGKKKFFAILTVKQMGFVLMKNMPDMFLKMQPIYNKLNSNKKDLEKVEGR